MGALAGQFSFGSTPLIKEETRRMLAVQRPMGPGHIAVADPAFVIGANVGSEAAGAFACVSHGEQWFAFLGRPMGGRTIRAIVEGVAASWGRSPREAMATVDADGCVVAWDSHRKRLSLARTAMSHFALHYVGADDGWSFATLAPALPSRGINLARLVPTLAGSLRTNWSDTAFVGVRIVVQGTIVHLDADGERAERFWHTDVDRFPRLADAQAGVRLRAALTDAVTDAVGREGSVGAQLSSGRDSGAVTGIAAALLRRQGRNLRAYTAVPSRGDGLHHAFLIGDEGPGAARVAARHANIRHHLLPSAKVGIGSIIDRHNRLLSSPHETPANIGWWSRLFERAKTDGCDCLLSGTMGNFTISAGGPGYLRDVLSEDGLAAWYALARHVHGHPRATWSGMIASSFGPHVPRAAWGGIQRLRGKSPPLRHRFLRGELGERVAAMQATRDPRPPASLDAIRRQILQESDEFDPNPEGVHGLPVLDPTSDRRVIEVSLAMRAGQLASGPDDRRIYALAFADVVPSSTIRPPGSGVQSADWFRAIDVGEMRDAIDRYAGCRIARDNIDFSAMHGFLDRWPDRADVGGALHRIYDRELMDAVSVASWLSIHAGDR